MYIYSFCPIWPLFVKYKTNLEECIVNLSIERENNLKLITVVKRAMKSEFFFY